MYASAGKRADAQKVLEHLKELSAHAYVAPYNVAVIYAGLGDRGQAFAWLNRAYDERSYLLAVYLTTDARLDSLHADPRFVDFADVSDFRNKKTAAFVETALPGTLGP